MVEWKKIENKLKLNEKELRCSQMNVNHSEKLLKLLKTTVHDTLVRSRKHNTLKSLSRFGRKGKTTQRIDRKILILAEHQNARTPKI